MIIYDNTKHKISTHKVPVGLDSFILREWCHVILHNTFSEKPLGIQHTLSVTDILKALVSIIKTSDKVSSQAASYGMYSFEIKIRRFNKWFELELLTKVSAIDGGMAQYHSSYFTLEKMNTRASTPLSNIMW